MLHVTSLMLYLRNQLRMSLNEPWRCLKRGSGTQPKQKQTGGARWDSLLGEVTAHRLRPMRFVRIDALLPDLTKTLFMLAVALGQHTRVV